MVEEQRLGAQLRAKRRVDDARFEVDPTYGDPDPAAPESYTVYEAAR